MSHKKQTFTIILTIIITLFIFGRLSAQEDTDQKVIGRYQKILKAKPREGSAFDRLYQLYLEGPGLERMLSDYEQAVISQPKEPSLHLILGHIYKRLGREQDAVKSYQQAATLDPRGVYPRLVLGQLLARLRDYEGAIKRLEDATNLEPSADDMVAIYKSLGHCYLRRDRVDDAVKAWKSIAELDPENVFSRLELADLFKEQELYDEAIEQHRAVIKLKESDAYRVCLSLREIGKIYELKEENERAIEAYENAIEKMTPDNWLRKALQGRIIGIYQDKKNLPGLIEYYQNKLKNDAQNVEVLGLLADVYVENEQVEEGIKTYRQALEFSPSDAHLRLSLINAMKIVEQYEQATGEYEELIKGAPEELSLYQELGELYLQLGQPEKAKETWARIEKVKPDDASTRLLLAEIYRRASVGQASSLPSTTVDFKAEAIEQYEKAIQLSPQNTDYVEYLGEYYYKQGDGEKAIETWNRMVAGENATGANYSRLSEVLGHHGFETEAIDATQKSVELSPQEFRYRSQLATLFVESGDYDEALKALEEASKVAPNEYFREQTRSQIIEIYRKQGVLDDKIAELEGEAENLQNLKTLARMYHQRGNVTKVMENLKKAVELAPEDTTILRWQAEIYERQGLFSESIKINERLIDIDKANAREYYGELAGLYARLGKKDEAKEAAKQAIAHSPRNPESYRLLADVALRWGETDEAIEKLTKAVRLQPDSTEIRADLARAYQRANKLYEAAEQYWRCFEKADNTANKLSFVSPLSEVYFQLARPEELVERFEEMHRSEKTDLTPLLALSELHKKSGNFNAARNALTRALEIAPQNPDLLRELVKLFADMGEGDKALKYQQELMAVEPSPENQRRYGELLFDAGNETEAAKIWKAMASAKGGKAKDEVQLARMFSRYGMTEEASAALQRASARTTEPKLLYEIGTSLISIGQADVAKSIFQDLIAMPPPIEVKKEKKKTQGQILHASAPPLSLSSSYVQRRYSPPPGYYPPQTRTGLSKFQLGSELMNRISRPYGYPGGTWTPANFEELQAAALVQLASIAQQEGELEKMMAELEAQAQTHPKDLHLLANLTKFYFLVAQNDRARATLEKILELSPDDVDVHQAILSLAQRKNEHEVIKRELEYLMSRDPENRARYLYGYANVLKRMEQQDEAERLMAEMYAEKDSSEPNFIGSYYRFLKDSKKDEEANRILMSALEEGHSNPRMVAMVCNFLVQEERFDEVEERLAKAVFEEPEDNRQIDRLYLSLGDAYVKSDDLEEAFEAYLKYFDRTKPEGTKPAGATTTTAVSQYAPRIPRYAQQVNFPTANVYYDRSRLEALRRMFTAFWQGEKLDALYARYEESLNSATGNDKLYPALALAYFHWWEGEKKEAVRFMDSALTESPGDLTLKLSVALMAVQAGEIEKGLELLPEVAQKSPQNRKGIARMLLQLASNVGNDEKAKEAVKVLLEPPVTAQDCMQLAQECQQYGFSAQAKEAAEKAMALSRGLRDPNLLIQLASIMSQMGLSKDSQTLAQRAVEISRTSYGYGGYSYQRYQPPSSYIFSQASRLLHPNVMRQREQKLKTAVKNNPNSYRAHLSLAAFYEGQNRVVEAIESLENALKIKPNDTQTRMRLARMQRRRGDNEKAVEHYAFLLEKNPSAIGYDFWDVIRAFFDARKTEKVVALAKESLSKPMLGSSYYGRNFHEQIARECLNRQLCVEAIELYEAMIKSTPENDWYYTSLADAYSKSGETQKGIELLKKRLTPEGKAKVMARHYASASSQVVYIESPDMAIINKLTELYTLEGKLNELLGEYQAKLNEYPDDMGLNAVVASMLIRSEKGEQAEPLVKKLIESKKPETQQYIQNLAETYMRQNQAQKAADIYEKVVKISPNASHYYDRLATAYATAGDKKKALSAWNKMLMAMNMQGRSQPYEKRRVAQQLQQYGMVEEAIKLYEEIVNTSFDRYSREDAQRQLTELLRRQGVDVEKRLAKEEKGKNLSLKRALARQYLESNQPDKAIELYKEIAEAAPGDRNSQQQLAQLYARTGKHDDAVAQWEALLKLEPGNSRFQSGLVNAYLNANRAEDALKFAQNMLAENPTAETHKLLGQAYARGNQQDKAIEAYKKSLDLNPVDYDVYKQLAQLYQGQENFKAAVNCYKDALKNVPDQWRRQEIERELIRAYARQDKLEELIKEVEESGISAGYWFYYELGRDYRDKGKLDKATEAYKKAVQLAAQRHERENVQRELLQILSQQGKLEKATEEMGIQPDYQFYFELARNYRNQKEFDKAIDVYKKALSVSAEEYQRRNANSELMQCYVESDKDELAFEAYLQMAKTMPFREGYSRSFHGGPGVMKIEILTESERHQKTLLDAFSRRNRLNALAGMLEKQLETSKDDRNLSGVLREMMGAIHMRRGEFDKAINDYEGALKFKPGDVFNAYRLAVALKRAGKDEQAEEALKKASALGTGRADTNFQLKISQICREGEFYEQAIELYKKSMAMMPSHYGGHELDNLRFGLAQLYVEAKLFDLAVETHENLATSARDEYQRRQANEQLQKLYQKPELYQQSVEKFKKNAESDPNDVIAHRSLAKLYEARRLTQKAIEHYKRTVELEPGDYNSHRSLGRLYRNAKNLKAAAESLQKAAESAPNQYERRNIYREALQNYAQAKQDEKALDVYAQQMEEVAGTTGYSRQYRGDGGIYIETEREQRQQDFLRIYQNRSTELIGILEKKLKETPDQVALWELAAALYTQQSQFDKAANAYEQSMKLNPGVFNAYRLAATLNKAGRAEDANEMLKKASAMSAPSDANFRSKVAQICSEGGFHEQAIDEYKQAMNMVPSRDQYQSDQIRFSLAKTYADAGKFEQALSAYETLATSARDEYQRRQADEQLQKLYKQPKIYEQFVKKFKSQIEDDPANSRAHHSLAKLYESQNMTDEAIAQYEKVDQLSPDDFNIRRKLGELNQKAKDFDAAEQHFKHAFQIAQKPNERETAIRSLWKLYIEDGKTERAVAEFEKFIAENQNEALAYELLGDGYRVRGDAEKADEAYDKWFDLRRTAMRTDRPHEYSNLAQSCLNKGVKLAEALDLAQQAVERQNYSYTQNILAQAYMANGQYERAIETYEQAMVSDQSNYFRQQVEDGIWNAYKQGNLYDLAIEKYKKMVESSPGDISAQRYLGRAYEESGRTPEAIVVYKTAIKETLSRTDSLPVQEEGWDDAFSDERADLERKLWGLYDAEKKYAEAIETFKSITESLPKDAPAYELLGDAYKKSGDEANAKLAYAQWFGLQKQQLDESDGEDAELFANLAKGCLNKDFRLDAALSYAQKAVELEGDNHNFIETLAHAYLKTGQSEKAKYELQQGASIYRAKNGWNILIESSQPHLDEQAFAAFWGDVQKGLPEHALLQVDLALAEFYQGQDRQEEAKKQWAKIGFLPEGEWWLIGPFPNPDGGAFGIPYPPEEQFDLEATYQGIKGEIKWEKRADNVIDGKVDLEKIFTPNQWAIAYAYTTFNSPEEKEVELRVGSDDDVKVWLNGEEVLSKNVARVAILDRDVVKAKLKAGENQILLKVCNRTGDWAFYFRIKEISAPETLSETPQFDESAYNFQGEIFIYYDENEPTSWVEHEAGKKLTESLQAQFTNQGLESSIGGAKGLREYMEANKNGIVVMALDIAPSTIFRGERNSFLKSWLDAGGKMIWTGDYEFYYYSIGRPDQRISITRWGATMTFDTTTDLTPAQSNEEPYYMTPTELGKKYIPSLGIFQSLRPAIIKTLVEHKMAHEIYASDGERADPVMCRPRGGKGYFVKIQMKNIGDIERLSQLMAEFIKNRFVSAP